MTKKEKEKERNEREKKKRETSTPEVCGERARKNFDSLIMVEHNICKNHQGAK